MGEQTPMDTIKGFVRTVWELDPAICATDVPDANATFSKPDDRTGSLELRRISTRRSVASTNFPNGARTDFYELYWADLTAGSTWQQLTAWVRHLLFRPLRKVPPNVRAAWVLLWLGAVLVIALGFVGLVPEALWGSAIPWLPQKLAIAAAVAFAAVLHRVATTTFGRVVRYTRADPDNIASRAAVRARGLALLRSLHEGSAYDRVIVVAHSLGSMLAYDLLTYFWAEQTEARTMDEHEAGFPLLRALVNTANALQATPNDATRIAFSRRPRGIATLLDDASGRSRKRERTVADQRSGDAGVAADSC
jgi:hypothetical protein